MKQTEGLRDVIIDPNDPVYVIGVVSRLVELPVWTLRLLDREEIVEPKRSRGKTRLYSMNDIQILVRISKLMLEQHVNVHGVRVILEMEEEVEPS